MVLFISGFIYLSVRERAHVNKGGAEAEGEAGLPLSTEPGAGLDPRAPGS